MSYQDYDQHEGQNANPARQQAIIGVGLAGIGLVFLILSILGVNIISFTVSSYTWGLTTLLAVVFIILGVWRFIRLNQARSQSR